MGIFLRIKCNTSFPNSELNTKIVETVKTKGRQVHKYLPLSTPICSRPRPLKVHRHRCVQRASSIYLPTKKLRAVNLPNNTSPQDKHGHDLVHNVPSFSPESLVLKTQIGMLHLEF
ncbi:uncharacterized protein CLUP02_01289 [Colletotrichum lupini]|uniref:Uncharacterized protein n=1 Tax=Colletotrichum lupini TaxID=145971 RepID=A0A9Q8SCM9_9PEZI|nr:uncharacterized protein CLUP02_01289 [Colletotrichum lupini]UQC74638.1 hypothetical protein CLUP02_01289 [Colletotrichum lupini]